MLTAYVLDRQSKHPGDSSSRGVDLSPNSASVDPSPPLHRILTRVVVFLSELYARPDQIDDTGFLSLVAETSAVGKESLISRSNSAFATAVPNAPHSDFVR